MCFNCLMYQLLEILGHFQEINQYTVYIPIENLNFIKRRISEFTIMRKVLNRLSSNKPIFLPYHSYIISRVSGQINTNITHIHINSLTPVFLKHTFQFNIHISMRLNLTFIKMHFPKMKFDCESEYLKVTSENQKTTFCAYYPKFNFYPKSNKVKIENLLLMMYRNFNMESKFVVLDKGLLYNSQVERCCQLTPPLVYSIPDHNYLAFYFIQVRKRFAVTFKISHIFLRKVLIFDGPSFLVKLLAPEKDLFETTTFHCIVQTIGNTNTLDTITYFEKEVKPKEYLKLYQSSTFFLHLPDQKCATNLCILFVETEFGYHVNATTLKIKTEGDFNPNCTYSGIVSTEEFNQEYIEKDTQCKSELKSIYSYKSSLLLIMFWYREHSRIHVKMMLSSTRCKPVEIDPCLLRTYYTDHVNLVSYQEKIMNLSQIRLSFRYPNINFFVSKNTCIILRLVNSDSLSQLSNALLGNVVQCLIGVSVKMGNQINMLRYFINNNTHTLFRKLQYIEESTEFDARLQSITDNNQMENSFASLKRIERTHHGRELHMFIRNLSEKVLTQVLFNFRGLHSHWVELVITDSKQSYLILQKDIPLSVLNCIVHQQLKYESFMTSTLLLRVNTPTEKLAKFKTKSLKIEGHEHANVNQFPNGKSPATESECKPKNFCIIGFM